MADNPLQETKRVTRIWGEEQWCLTEDCLAKTLIVEEPLSIQVHPVKWECWRILKATGNSCIYAGLNEMARSGSVDLRSALENDRFLQLMLTFPAEVGMTIVLPAGIVHACSGGLTIFEVQAVPDDTWRLWDWHRDRELHVEEGLRVLDRQALPQVFRPL